MTWLKQIGRSETRNIRLPYPESRLAEVVEGCVNVERQETIDFLLSNKAKRKYRFGFEKVTSDDVVKRLELSGKSFKYPPIIIKEPPKPPIAVEAPVEIPFEKRTDLGNNFSISVLCCNRLDKTKKCIESILDSKNDSTYELIITDNKSKDKTRGYISSLDFDFINKVFHEENLGFIGGHKYVLEMANNDIFLMLNNDTIVTDYWLDKIYEQFADAMVAAVGIHGAMILQGGSGARVHHKIGFDYIEGSCLAVPRKFIKLFGLFDPEYRGSYYEDADLCLRLRRSGYKLNIADVKVIHNNSVLTINTIENGWDTVKSNKEIFMRKWSNYLKTKSFD